MKPKPDIFLLVYKETFYGLIKCCGDPLILETKRLNEANYYTGIEAETISKQLAEMGKPVKIIGMDDARKLVAKAESRAAKNRNYYIQKKKKLLQHHEQE